MGCCRRHATAGRFRFPCLGRIENLLEQTVELAGASLSTGGRAEHLHLVHRIDAVPGQVFPYQMPNPFCSQLRLWGFQPETIGLGELGGRGEMRELTGIDPVGIGDDVALGRLAEDFGQSDDRDLPGGDEIL